MEHLETRRKEGTAMRKWLVGALATSVMALSTVAWAGIEVVPVEATFDGIIHPGLTTGEGTYTSFTSTGGKIKVVLSGGNYQDTAFAAGETVQVTRTLTPDGKLGEVVMRFVAKFGEDGVGGTWSVISGSGPYARIKGQGTFQAIVLGTTSDGGLIVQETLEGQLTSETGK